jgi:hypothetical protein
MSLARSFMLKEWPLHRTVLQDAVVFAVCGSFIAPWSTVACVLVFSGLVAARVGARLGQDLCRSDTLEFMLTRPIDRGAFVRHRLAFGSLPVLVSLGLVFLIVGSGLRRIVLDALAGAAPWLEREASAGTHPTLHGIAVVFVGLIYVCAFEVGLSRSTHDPPGNVAFEGAVRAGFLALIAWLVSAAVPSMVSFVWRRSSADESTSLGPLFGPEWGIGLLSIAALAGMLWLRVRRSERWVRDYEAGVDADGSVTARRSHWIVAVLVLVLVGGLLVVWLLPVTSSPRVVPAGASTIGGK